MIEKKQVHIFLQYSVKIIQLLNLLRKISNDSQLQNLWFYLLSKRIYEQWLVQNLKMELVNSIMW